MLHDLKSNCIWTVQGRQCAKQRSASRSPLDAHRTRFPGGARSILQVNTSDFIINICREIKDALQDETTDVQYTLPTEKILHEYMRQPFCIVIMDVYLAGINGILLYRLQHQALADLVF